jgi:Fe-S cluster assembly protein SufD
VSLARAIETGDLAELPSRRQEDWRWTDLRALVRELPAKAGPGHAWGPGLFSQIEARQRVEVVNGQGPASLTIDGGETVELRFIADGAGSSVSRLRIHVRGEGGLLLETYESQDASIAAVELDIVIDPHAALERIVVSEGGDDAILAGQADVRLHEGSRLAQVVLTGGGRRQRLQTDVLHPGMKAEVQLDGAYVVGGQRHADITTVVTHAGVGGATSQLIKGVVSGQGRGVFQGRIVVEEGADRTDARMGHHALLLSDRAEVDAKPELLIYADDVSCAHGNTVGALDEDALFYARQRGIPDAEAKAMLTEAFVGEVIDRIGHEAARDVARAWAAAQLGGQA